MGGVEGDGTIHQLVQKEGPQKSLGYRGVRRGDLTARPKVLSKKT